MNENTKLWARTVGSVGAGLLGAYLIAAPFCNNRNPLDDNLLVKEYLSSENDMKRIDKQINKAREEYLWLHKTPTDKISSNYWIVNNIPNSRIKALEEIRHDYELYNLDLKYSQKVNEWRRINNKKRDKSITNPLLGSLLILGSYVLFSRRKKHDSN